MPQTTWIRDIVKRTPHPPLEEGITADVIVIGNAIEKDVSLIKEMAAAIHSVPVKA